MKIRWVAVHDTRDSTRRLMTWTGNTEHLVVIGLSVGFARNCPSPVEVPEGCTVECVRGTFREALRLAETRGGGVVFTVFAEHDNNG